MYNIKEAISAISIGILVAEFLRKTGRVLQAVEVYKSAINIMKTMEDTQRQALWNAQIGVMLQLHGQYKKAREYQEKALTIRIEIGDRDGEATSYGNLGTLFRSLNMPY